MGIIDNVKDVAELKKNIMMLKFIKKLSIYVTKYSN